MEPQQGKGSRLGTQRPGEDALNREELAEAGDLVGTEMRRPIQRIATLLGLDDYADVIGRSYLARCKGIRIDHVLEQVVARHPTPREAHLLGIGRKDPMLALYVTGRDASGTPVLVLEIAMPGDRHALEHAYQVN